MSWYKELGEKTGRTDIWVILIGFLFVGSAYFHFACGTGLVGTCNDNFLQYNQWLLTTMLLGFFVDLGIKQWQNIKNVNNK